MIVSIWNLLLGGVFGILLGIGLVLLFGFCRRWLREHGRPPWFRIRSAVVWGAQEPTLDHVIGVSRHHIAESGLVCPVCGSVAANRGDYTNVRRMLINGIENEIVECQGEREVENERDVSCGAILAASPDTEHGDHLDEMGQVVSDGSYDPPDFWRFVRIGKEQAIREEFGEDAWVKKGPHGANELFVKPVEGSVAPPKTNKHDVLVGEDLQKELRRLAIEEQQKATEATTKITIVPPADADTVIVPTLPPKP